METKKKSLRIIAFTDHTPQGDAAMNHALFLCSVFKAELCVLPLTEKEHSHSFKKILELANQKSISVIENLSLPNLKKEIYAFAEEINAMMMVLPVSKTKGETFFSHRKAFRLIYKSRIPVLVVGKTPLRENAYQHIILPLDFSIYSKEKSLWASYFNRFYGSCVHVLYKNYKDEYLRYKLKENVGFTENLYSNLDVSSFEHHVVDEVKKDIDVYAKDFAQEVKGSLVLSMTTKYPTLFDVLFGSKEKKTIQFVDTIPYLYINQRDDLYVLCT